ncbi:hypothetical protein J3R30DRAFT_3448114 [Lentinula aciculospora]|uniref:Uncharacterized protein n=1 Tax=Lentinula aciculospora TaxID=153920 RepID=A0A9W9AIN6_9AGAR|nr:hypothetical protein J3R30DRAFT_3448114 [Lentinula aciculospora]
MGKYCFYVVTVGKDVGVFTKWLQAKHVREGASCEGYELKDEAIKAFDEAMINGFVQISGSFDQPYQSPRIHPPLDCPPYSCGPTSVAVVPTSPPPTPARPAPVSSTPATAFFPPAVFENASSGDVPGYAQNVTLRSPKREKPAANFQYCTKQNKDVQTTRTRGGCPECGCECTANFGSQQQEGADSTTDRAQSTKGKEPTRRYEVSVISSESESDDDASSSTRQKVPSTPRRMHTIASIQGAHETGALAKPVLRTLSAPTNSLSSPLVRKPNQSPSRLRPNILIDISDADSYPSASTASSSDTDPDSSGPEDVTPLRTRLLSPLISPDFKNAVLMDAVNNAQLLRNSTVPNSPSRSRRRDTASGPTVSKRANTSIEKSPRVVTDRRASRAGCSPGRLGLHQCHVPSIVYNDSCDPRSPILRNRLTASGEPK